MPMAVIGAGYGSECHLLRYLGRHRRAFDARVGAAIGGEVLGWLDFHFDPGQVWPDGERKGIDFVDDAAVQAAWRAWWPQGSGIHSWDAVGCYRVGGEEGWLLVEAKANLEELASDCKAKPAGGRAQIEAALAEVKRALGVDAGRDWLCGHYQHANRIAALHFLVSHGVAARLLYVYFCGDRTPSRSCPADAAGWCAALEAERKHLGLPAEHALRARMHALHLPVVLPACAPDGAHSPSRAR
jgi:hypothetical protein